MLNVGAINEGFVLDHIPAGEGMEIYRMLGLDKLDCGVAIIRNATSSKMGRKDILKAECPIDSLDMNILDILGFITNVIRCTNPRCITSIERGLPQEFLLTDPDRQVYRCRYCEEKYHRHP